MIRVSTQKQSLPTGQHLDADICFLLKEHAEVTPEMAVVVRDYIRTALNGRIHQTYTKAHHDKFFADMEQFGGLAEKYIPVDWDIIGTDHTLMKLAIEKYVYARVHAAVQTKRDDPMDIMTIMEIESAFRGEMQKLPLRFDWVRFPSDPNTPEIPLSFIVDIYLPCYPIAERMLFHVNLHGEVMRGVNDSDSMAAYVRNNVWLPEY